jgi:hypothetical protein
MDLIDQNIIDSNTEKIYIIYEKIKEIYDNLNIEIIIKELENNDNIIKLIEIFSNESKYITRFLKDIKIMYYNYENLYFYYIYKTTKKFIKDKNKLELLIRQTITLMKYFNIKHNVKVIWIPINKKRDFKYNIINDKTLSKSINNFNAFCCSGVTFINNNEKISIISRYEEIHKLLFHELLHNFNIDGHNFHNQLHNELKKYKKIKKNNYHYEYSIYESVTELLSSYFNIIFLQIYNKQKNVKNNIKKSIIIELFYSINLIVNLGKLNNYSNFNDFISNIHFKGNICFFEYYLVKSLLYNYLDFNKLNICNYNYLSNVNDYKILYNHIINICTNNINNNIIQYLYNLNIHYHNFKYCYSDFD